MTLPALAAATHGAHPQLLVPKTTPISQESSLKICQHEERSAAALGTARSEGLSPEEEVTAAQPQMEPHHSLLGRAGSLGTHFPPTHTSLLPLG